MAQNYKLRQENIEQHRMDLKEQFNNEFIPKEYYTNGLQKSDPGEVSTGATPKFMSFSTIIELLQLVMVLLSSIPLNLLNWAAHLLFNEMTVGSACYQLALIVLPIIFSKVPICPLKVDYAILYSKELQFASTQVFPINLGEKRYSQDVLVSSSLRDFLDFMLF